MFSVFCNDGRHYINYMLILLFLYEEKTIYLFFRSNLTAIWTFSTKMKYHDDKTSKSSSIAKWRQEIQ
jgi:hypothetical protein